MRWLLSLLTAAVLATAVAGAPPKVPGKVVTVPGGRAVIEIEAPEKDKTVAWRAAFADEDCFVDELRPLRPDTIRLIILPNKARIYYVTVWSGLTKDDSASVVIDATGGPVPEPLPPNPNPPTPNPPSPNPPTPNPPSPNPTAKRLSVVVIEETKDRTAAQGKVLLDPGVRDWLKTGKHEMEILDKDDKSATSHGFLPFANRVGLPAVLVFDADATGPQVPLKSFKLPATAAEWKTELEGAVTK